jgi:PKD domain-containing protein
VARRNAPAYDRSLPVARAPGAASFRWPLVLLVVVGVVVLAAPLGTGIGRAASPAAGPTLTVTGATPGSIGLAWNSSSGVLFDHYEVSDSTAGPNGPWHAVAALSQASDTAFYWDGLVPGNSYWWEVVAYATPISSATSNVVQQVQPPSPTLTAAMAGPGTVNLSWTNSASYGGSVVFASYVVQESANNGSFTNLTAITEVGVRSDSVSGLQTGTNYRFVLRTSDGCQGASNCASFSSSSVSRSPAVRVSPPDSLAAQIVGAPASLATGATGTFQCAAQGGRSPVTFTWNFGDGRTLPGRNVTHSFVQAGTYPVACLVHDGLGTNASATARVTVAANASGTSGGGGSGGGGGGGLAGPSASTSSLFGPAVAVFLLLTFVAAVVWLGWIVNRRSRPHSVPPGAFGQGPALGPPPPGSFPSSGVPEASALPDPPPPPPRDLDELFDQLESDRSTPN